MVATVPVVTNWSVTPQNGQIGYFTLMNTWLFESTSVIASLNTAINKINEAGNDINEIGQNAINAISLDTIEDLATYTGTGLVIVKDLNRGGTFIYDATQSAVNNGGTVFNGWVRQYSGAVNVKWFGADYIGMVESSPAFTSAISAALSENKKSIIAEGSFKINSSINGMGLDLIGSNTLYTGSGVRKNFRTHNNYVNNGVNTMDREFHPSIKKDLSTKAIIKISDNSYYVFTAKPTGNGYVLTNIKNDVITQVSSLGGSISSFRTSIVLNCVECLVGITTPSASNGVWLSEGVDIDVPAYTSGSALSLNQSFSSGAWIEFTVDVGDENKLSVELMTDSTSSSSVTITIDGVAVSTNISLITSTRHRLTKEYQVSRGTHIVRIANNASTKFEVIGLNVVELINASRYSGYTNLGYYRNSALSDYITTLSANDYAIYDTDASLWGGSYHGGETINSEEILMDGSTISLATREVKVGKSLEFIANVDIDWTTNGGGILNLDKKTIFNIGGYSLSNSFTGDVNAAHFYTTLVGVNTAFDKIIIPKNLELSSYANDTKIPLNRAGRIEYKNSTTSQSVSIEHSQYSNEELQYVNSAFIWKVDSSYHKYYYGTVANGLRNIKDITAVINIEFT